MARLEEEDKELLDRYYFALKRELRPASILVAFTLYGLVYALAVDVHRGEGVPLLSLQMMTWTTTLWAVLCAAMFVYYHMWLGFYAYAKFAEQMLVEDLKEYSEKKKESNKPPFE